MKGPAALRRIAGFTLLELVVTMVILGILSAVAMSKLNQPQVDAAWFPDQVRAVVRLARSQAIAQRARILVVVGASQLSLCYATTAVSFTCGATVSDLATGSAIVLNATRSRLMRGHQPSGRCSTRRAAGRAPPSSRRHTSMQRP